MNLKWTNGSLKFIHTPQECIQLKFISLQREKGKTQLLVCHDEGNYAIYGMKLFLIYFRLPKQNPDSGATN